MHQGSSTKKTRWGASRAVGLIATAWVLGIFPAALPAQTIRIGTPVPVATGLAERPLIEPYIAAHPADPNHLLAAAMVSVPADDSAAVEAGLRCSSFLTLDGGMRWTRHEFPVTQCFDPWTAITPDGHATFSAIGPRNELFVFRSADGGRSWEETPVSLGPGHDHPMIVANARAPERAGWLYAVSSQEIRADNGELRFGVYVARSRNAGKSFDAPVWIIPSNLLVKAETPAVLSDGTLVVPYVAIARKGIGGFEADTGTVDLTPWHAWMVRSTDGGHTFSIPLFVTEACGPPGFSPFALSALAADPSTGPFRDRLYFACNLAGGGTVVVTASADGGEEWTDPIAVPSAPLAVNRRGVLGVLWADRWGVDDEPRCYAVFFAASRDGGRTFLPAHRLTRGRSCIDVTANGSDNAMAWPTGGDYYGLTAAPDGRTISVPLAWYPRLLHGTAAQRSHRRVAGGGFGIHRSDLDEDLR